MSKQIDERVVEMQFDNKQFEKNIAQSTKSLEDLKTSLKMDNAAKSFNELEKAAKKVDLSALSKSVEDISNKFTLAGRIAMAYMDNIANKIVSTAARIGSALLIDPVRTGFSEYELKMDSVKTIMNATGESIETVTKYLEELNKYADDTIYSFSDMTSNIGKFTNNGVKLDDAVAAIKGISNAAALAGAGTAQASSAMYNLSQSLSSFLNTRDWYSIENAQMATVGFKQALIDTAVELGTLKKESDGVYKTINGNHEVTTKNFRDTLQYQWGTSEVIIETLKKYSDTSTELGQKAQEAATQVRTLSKMWDALREAAQSGWGQTWEIVFGNLEEATELFTNVSNVISEILNKQSDTRNEILGIWKTLGGRTSLINAGASIFKTIREVVTEIKKELFNFTPQQIAITLDNISEKVEAFATNLRTWVWSSNEYNNDWPVITSLRKGAKGIQSIFGIIWDLVGSLWDGVKKLFPSLGNSLKSTLTSFGKMGEWFTNLRSAIRKGQIFSKFTQSLVDTVKPLVDYIPTLWEKLKSAFSSLGGIFSKFKIGDKVKSVFTSFTNFLPKAGDAIWSFCENVVTFFKESQIFSKIGGVFESIWDGISSMLTVFSTAINKIGKLGIGEWLADTFTNIANTIGRCAKSAWAAIKGFFTGIDYGYIWITVSGWFTSAWNAVTDFFTGIDYAGMWGKISAFFKGAWGDVKGFFGGIDYRAAWTTVSTWFSETWNTVKGYFASIDYAGIWGKVSSAFATGWAAVKGFFGKIDYAAVWKVVSGWFTTAWSAVKGFFTGIDYAGIWNKVSSAFSSGWSSAKKIFSSIGETLFGADTWNKFANSKGVAWIKGAFASVGNAVKDAVEWLKSIFASIDLSGIKNWFKDIFLTSEDSLSETEDAERPMGQAAEKTENIFTKIGNTLKGVWNKITKIANWWTKGKIVGFGVLALLVKAALAIINLVNGAGKALSRIGKDDGPTMVDKLEALSKFILTVGGVIAGLALLNTVIGGNMWSAVGQLAAVVGALAAITVLAQWLGKKISGGSAILDPLFQMGTGLAGMFIAIKAFALMRWGTLISGLVKVAIVITIVMSVMLGLQWLADKLDAAKSNTTLFKSGARSVTSAAKGLLALSAALVLLTIPISVFGAMNFWSLVKGVGAVAILLAALGAVAMAAGDSNFKFSNGAGILMMVLSIIALVPSIIILGMLDVGMLIQGGAVVAGIGAFLYIMLKQMQKINTQCKNFGQVLPALAMVASLAGTLWVFASSIDRISDVDWTTIAAFSLGFSVAIIAFAKAIKILGKLNIGTAMKGITLLGVAVLALSVVASIAAAVVGSGLEAFTSYLAPIGQNLAAFATAVKDVDKDKITAAGEALLSIAELCGQSFLYSFSGGQIQSFTEKATSIAYNIAAFSTAVANVSVSNVENASKALKIITAMMMDAKTNGTTSDIPVTMTEHALSVASNLNGFCTRLSNFSLLKIISAKTGLTQISSLMSYASNNGTTSDTPVTMTEHALSVATNLTAFCERLGEKFNLIKIVAACAGIVMLSSTFVGIAEADTTKIDSFSDNLTKVGGGLSQFMDGIAAYDDAGKQKIENASELMGKIKQLALDLQETTGIADQLNDISGAVTTLGSALDLYYKMASGVGETGEGTTTLSPEQVGEGLGAMISAVVAKLPDDNAVQAIAAYAGGEGTGNNMSLFAAGLNAIARALKDYGTNCDDLDEDAVKLGNSVLDEVTKIPGKLSGENNLLSFLSSNQTSLSSFATDLTSISTGLGNFATNTKDLTSGSVSAASEALTLLVGLQNSLDSSASIWSFLRGDNSLGSFATTLPTIGDGLKDFYHRTWHISSKMAAGGIEMLTQLTTANINYSNIGQLANAFGGAGGWATGAEDLKTFTEHLTTMGDSIGGFYKATKDISAVGEGEKFGSVQLLDQLIALSTKYGNTLNIGKSFWGITGIFTGSGDLSSFTGKFEAISGHIGTFYTNISQVDFTKTTDAVGFLTLMASLESTFPNLGSSNLEALGGRLADFSASLLTMNNNLTSLTLNEDNYARMVAIIREFIGLQASLNEVMAGQTVDMNKIALSTDATDATSMTNFLTFGSAIVEVADMITMANSELSGDNVANFELAADGLSHLVNAIYTAQGLSEADGANLVEVIRGFVDNNLSDKQINTDNMVGAWMLWIGKSIAGSVGVLTTDIQTFMTGVTTTFDTYVTSFETSGQNFALGFAGGLTNEAALAATISAANTLASTALSTLNTALDEHSPSKKTEKSGKYFTLGFIEGAESYNKSLKDSMQKIGDVATEGLNDSLIGSGKSATNILGNLLKADAKSIASDVGTTIGETIIDKATGGLLNKYKGVAGTLEDFSETLGVTLSDVSLSDATDLINVFKEGGTDAATAYLNEIAESDPNLKKLLEYANIYGITGDSISSTAGSLGSVSDAIAASGSSVSKAAVDMSKIISLYDAINKVGSSVDLLGEKVASMQIVMDSGALVGSIETQIDTRLGTMTALRSRGV